MLPILLIEYIIESLLPIAAKYVYGLLPEVVQQLFQQMIKKLLQRKCTSTWHLRSYREHSVTFWRIKPWFIPNNVT